MDNDAIDRAAAPTGARRPRQGRGALTGDSLAMVCRPMPLCRFAARTLKRTIHLQPIEVYSSWLPLNESRSLISARQH